MQTQGLQTRHVRGGVTALPQRVISLGVAGLAPFSSRPCIVARVAADLSPAPAECPIYQDKDGKTIKAMCADYGFRSGSGRLYQDHYGEVPEGVVSLAKANFQHELQQLRRSVRFNPYRDAPVPSNPLLAALHSSGIAVSGYFASLDKGLEDSKLLPVLESVKPLDELMTEEFQQVKSRLDRLQLSIASVNKEEEERIVRQGKDMISPLLVKIPFYALCLVLDVVYDKKPIQKFWVLETVARIPYFAYISILHLYESLGFWRAGAELRKIHFAEEWNEMHHLQIMESLGGDMLWFDRFIAEHSAIAYYWLMIVYYLVNPKAAYNFMQRVEHHAADTYAAFIVDNEPLLKTIPAPTVALDYYLNEDLYLFDEFQTASKGKGVPPRRPKCENLYDVFVNIRDDENEHVKTLIACQESTIAKDIAAAQALKRGSGRKSMESMDD